MAAAFRKCRARPCVLLGLACVLGSPVAYATCPDATQNSELRGSVNVDLGVRVASLVRVRQFAEDFLVYVDSDAAFWLNDPGGRNSIDYLVLERALHGAAPVLCFYSVFAQGAPGRYSVSELDLDREGAALLRPVNEAGAYWQGGNSADFARSGELFEALSVTAPQVVDVAFDMRLFSALTNVELLRYQQAVAMLEALATDYPGHPDLYKVRFQLGKVYLRQRQHEDAIRQFEAARDLIGDANPADLDWLRFERAEIESWLGEAYVHDGDLDAADAVLTVAINDASPDFALLGQIFDNKGLVGIRRGEVPGISRSERLGWYDVSTEDHLSAAYFSRNAGDRDTLQVIENNIAIHYARVGEPRKSIVHFLNVLRMFDEVDNPEWRAFLLSNLSNYTRILGDYSKALVYLEQSFALSTPVGSFRYAGYYCRMGALRDLLGDAAAGLADLRRCLDEATREGDAYTELDARLQLSRQLLGRGELEAAEAMVEPAETLLGTVNDRVLTRRTWIQRARLALDAQRLIDAEHAIEEALAEDINALVPNETVEALEIAMRIEQALGRDDEAFAYGERAMALIERQHSQLEAERLGPAWSNQSSSLYELVTASHIARYRNAGSTDALARALDTMERSRDISLRQRLSTTLPNDSASLEEEKRLALYSDIASLLAQSGRQGPLPGMGDLAYYHQHDLLSLARLSDVEVVDVPAPLDLVEVQQKLRTGQLVLYYVAAADTLHLLLVSADSFSLAKSVPLQDVQRLVAAMGDVMKAPSAEAIGLLRQLSVLLLPDMTPYAGTRELLIVPHTGLHTVPFAALTLMMVDGAPYVPLIAGHTLTVLPSLSSYFMDKPQRNVEYTTGVAILADPVFTNMDLAAVAPPLTLAANDLRGWSDTLQPLPYTAREAANIASQFPGRTLAYTGAAANRRNLSSPGARNAKVLHIATHGYFDSISADNVGLALSTVDESGEEDPGFITLTELFGYAFNNQLVVISGCETALGKEQAGVGLNGLTRGFLAQGVRHVISTLWPVSDRATAEFMRLFYRHLDASGNVALALQRAQQELGNNPDYRNPYFWAGFVLTSIDPDATVDLSE